MITTTLTEVQVLRIAAAHYLADMDALAPGERLDPGAGPVGYVTGACTVAEDAAELGIRVVGDIANDAYRCVCDAYETLRRGS